MPARLRRRAAGRAERVAAAAGPAWLSSTGTSRHATTRCPSASTVSFRSCSSSAARPASRGRKHTATPYDPSGRQLRADLVAEKRIRQLQRHARAVAGARVGALGAAVLEVRERRRRAHERLVARDAVEPCDEGDAARVVLVRRVVEADGLHEPALPSRPSRLCCALDRGGERAGGRLARSGARDEGGLEGRNRVGSYTRSLHRFPV